MSKHLSILISLAFGLLLLTAPVHAGNPYFSGCAGLSFSGTQNIDNAGGTASVKLPLDAGPNLQGALGYREGRWRAEGELGYQNQGLGTGGRGHLRATSFLVNGYCDFSGGGMEPYLTAGIGGAGISMSDWSLGSDTYSSSGSTTKVAWQAGAGISFPICVCKCTAVDLRYRYFATTRIADAGHAYTPSNSALLLGLRVGF
ncbi:MAG: outer membrane beta-barrel protein [Chlorobiaceae bacterium]